MAWLWTVLIIAFIVLETATAQFVCIWFAGGALAALICALFTENMWLQVTVFLIVAALLLIFTKKLVYKLKGSSSEKTNVDALIGESAIVTEDISNIEARGTVKVRGMVWSARSQNGDDISKGTLVTIEKIDGVKLIVIPTTQTNKEA